MTSRRHYYIECELASLVDLPYRMPIPWFAVRVLRCGSRDQGRRSLALGAEPVLSTLKPGHSLDQL
jgi:hypothetical protein